MLELLGKLLQSEYHTKYCVIFSDHQSIFNALNRSLDEFGIISDFRSKIYGSEYIFDPEWAGNRDFDVGSIKIKLSSGIISSKFSFYFCNLDDCWFSIVLKITGILDCESFIVRSSPSNARPDEYIQELTVLNSGERARVLRVSYDNGWQFFKSGMPLPFEDGTVLENRQKKARLSRAYLFSLADKLIGQNSEGVPPFLNCEWERHGIGQKVAFRAEGIE